MSSAEVAVASDLFGNYLLMHSFFQLLLHMGVAMESITETKLATVVEHGRLLASMRSTFGALSGANASHRAEAAKQVLQRGQPSFLGRVVLTSSFAWHSSASRGCYRHCFVLAREFQPCIALLRHRQEPTPQEVAWYSGGHVGGSEQVASLPVSPRLFCERRCSFAGHWLRRQL